MTKMTGLSLLAAALVAGACGDPGTTDLPDPLFPPKPECEGAGITPYAGQHPQVISKLEIGTLTDGFDLDGDGDPDNKLGAIASLAMDGITDSFKDYGIIIPIEFFDLAAAAPDTCVKFALYLGNYVTDTDGDGNDAYVPAGDCNDHDMAIKPGAAEIDGNFKDDDCDGKADEDAQGNLPNDMMDRDSDGVSVGEGDCDDTNAMVHPGQAEICGDGLDNDCDGVADRTEDAQGVATACSPYAPGEADITLDPLSFVPGTMEPVISFKDGVISERDGKLKLDAGPSLFSVAIPVSGDITLDLRISGATVEADVVQAGSAIELKNVRLGGVIDARTADALRGLSAESVGLRPEDSLLDATFANLLGPLLAMPKASDEVQAKYPNCRTPDIDVDQDGLEAFCDSNPDDTVMTVDVCIDGDGTEVLDVTDAAGNVMMHCTDAMNGDKLRFVDGISVALKFDTTHVKSIQPPQ